MASAAVAMVMSLPGSASPPAPDRRRDGVARESGKAVVELLRRGITARDILTKEAFENAIAVVIAFGGSNHEVLRSQHGSGNLFPLNKGYILKVRPGNPETPAKKENSR